MAETIVIRKASDVGLKDLEIFYNPELLLELGDEDRSRHYVKKTLITSAIVLALNAPISSARAQNNNIVIKAPEMTCLVDAVQQIDTTTETIISEALAIINERKQIFFTEDEQAEMEIIDSYYSQAKKRYPPKGKISF